MAFEVNNYIFEANDNFDLFNDLSLDPIIDIMPNLTFSSLFPSNSTSPSAPEVKRYRDVKFGNQGRTYFRIPLLYVKITEENNLWFIKNISPTLNSSYGLCGTEYYESSYIYSSSHESTETYRTGQTTSIDNFLGVTFANNATGYSNANNASYLTYDMNYSYYTLPMYINTNIPIIVVDDSFDSSSNNAKAFAQHQLTLDDYIAADEHILGLLNGPEEVILPITEYVCTAIANEYTFNEFGDKEPTGSPTKYRAFKIRSRKKFSLYKIAEPENGNLYYGISFEDLPEAAYYSNDDPTFSTWMQVPGQPQTLPFNRIWRAHENEVGTFYCVDSITGLDDNIPEWENEEDADDYNDGNKDIEDANNWGDISGGFPPKNNTGEDNPETEFGEVKTRGFFSQQYILDATALAALANDLFDTSTSFWEAISAGLRMYGDNPIEAVMGLSFWPFPLDTVFSGLVTAEKIWFGGYGWDVSAGSAKKIFYPNGYKSLGSIAIKRTFNSWRDFAPYTRLYVSLPYCGVYELELERYYNKTVEVRYFFDTRTNGCLACLLADGHLMDYFNGQMGVTMPITLTDYAGYANSQISTLLGAGALAAVAATGLGAAVVGAGGAALGLAGTAVGGSGLAAAGAAFGAAGAAGAVPAIALGGGAVAGTALGAKTVYGLTQNNINKHNVTKGGSSSMINEYLPQYVEFIFEIQKDCAPSNYVAMYGKPSMKSGSISNFQGFLKCQSVKLDCGVATENEKNQIKTMLLNGIYI